MKNAQRSFCKLKSMWYVGEILKNMGEIWIYVGLD